ncbi:MAG: YigZ family protein [Clostridia bacterium]|nr:YigZ family protein [Clostridia bacterium]
MDTYLTVFGQNETEYVEKRSRFITTLRHCETEAEASAFLEEMRSKYWDARHNCFAYSVEEGKLCRYHDDGEPHGTAGKPMFDVIVGSKITNIAVVVTRYFGGVLLGTGGLVRAYSKSVQDVLSGAEVFKMVPSAVLSVTCDYTDHGKLVNLISSVDGVVENTDFAENVTVEFCLKKDTVFEFEKKLTETFSARLKFDIKQEKLTPFKEK